MPKAANRSITYSKAAALLHSSVNCMKNPFGKFLLIELATDDFKAATGQHVAT